MNYKNNGIKWGQSIWIEKDINEPTGRKIGHDNIAEKYTIGNSCGKGLVLVHCNNYCIARYNREKNAFSILFYACWTMNNGF